MKIAVTGSTGLIGSHLVALLEAEGHEVIRLVRRPPQRPGELEWNPAGGKLPVDGVSGAEAVIHLAGENIQGRWTRAKRQAVLESRVKGTSLLAHAVAEMANPPRAFLCASAAGYGNRGEEVLTDQSELGEDFLGQVCRAWETAATPAQRKGIRTVHLRFAMILDRHAGALAAMLPAFRLGIGGRVGSGRQFWSWVAIDDAVAAIRHVLVTAELAGPVNICSPNPITNRDFTRALGHALGRPTFLPVTATAARLAFGQVADELLLASIRAVPQKLLDSGFSFKHPQIEQALEVVLRR